MSHRHRPVQRHELVALHHLQMRELRDERRDLIVELPLALLVEGHHGDRDDRLGHRSDAEDGIFAEGLRAFEPLTAIAAELHQLAVTGDHNADAGVVAGVDLRLHGTIHAIQALGREADGVRRRNW